MLLWWKLLAGLRDGTLDRWSDSIELMIHDDE